MKVFVSWSGGKESAMATYRAISQDYQVSYLVNFISENGERSRSHGIKAEVLRMQSEAIGIPMVQVRTSWGNYEENFKKVVENLKEEGIEGGIFGDIEVEEHREWVERVCAELGVKACLPLWGCEPEELIADFWALGFKSVIVATRLDEKLLGRDLDRAFLTEIQKFNCHPCGESGEYHTFVTGGNVSNGSLKVVQGKREKRDNVWFLELSAEFE
mgnify:CR=1 FL=1